MVHVFKLDVDGAQPEEMEPEDGEEGGNGITAAMHWMLPSEELQVGDESIGFSNIMLWDWEIRKGSLKKFYVNGRFL